MNVTSSYKKCVNLCETDTVIFWADNFEGQNKNWIFSPCCIGLSIKTGAVRLPQRSISKGDTHLCVQTAFVAVSEEK